MPLGDIGVRPDWRQIEQRQHAGLAAKSNLLQLALIGYGLTALIAASWFQAPPWAVFLQGLLFAAAFLWAPLNATIPKKADARKSLIIAAIVLSPIVGLAFLTAPVSVVPATTLGPRLSPWLSLLIPAASAALFFSLARRHADLSHALGFASRAWVYQALVGLALGTALGFHLWSTVSAAQPQQAPALPGPATLVWLLAVQAGLLGLGEEIALRGVLFRMAFAEQHRLHFGLFVRIVALDAPLYLAPVMHHTAGGSGLLMGLAYGVVFALLATILRFSFRSITASLAANVAFHLFFALVMLT